MSKYLSKENLENLFHFISQDIKNIGIDITQNDKFKKATKKLMKSINRQVSETGKSLNLQQLNQYSSQKIKPFLVEMYQREQEKQAPDSGLNLTGYNDGPLLGLNLNEQENEVSELDALFQNASITNNQPIQNDSNLSTEDFAKRLDEFARERGQSNPFDNHSKMVNETSEFRENLKKANDAQEKERQRHMESKKRGNEFFATLDPNKNEPILDRGSFAGAYNSKPLVTKSSKEKKVMDKVSKAAENNSNNPYFQINPDNDARALINQITVNNRDHSNDNAVAFDPNKTTAEMLSVYNREAKIPPKIFENTQTFHERTNRHTVIIDTGDLSSPLVTNTGSDTSKGWYKWKADLDITLKVEGISDIFLESFAIRGQTVSDNCEYFVLDIDKFDVESHSNNSNLRDRLTIPNNHMATEFYNPAVTFDGTGSAQSTTTVETTIETNKVVTDINVTDSIYLGNGDFVGNVTAVRVGGNKKITLDSVRHTIQDGASLFIGQHRMKVEKYDANANYIGTINPKNLNVIEFTLTNQDGEHAETGDNKTFHEAAATNNRIILEFSIVSRHYDDFQVKNRENIAAKPI